MIISGTIKTKRICTFLTLMCMTLFPEIANADKAAKLNDDGIESYNEQKLEESINRFTEALVERPDSPELRFNRGTALSAAGKTEEAVNELEKSANIFTTKDLSAAAHYNSGNTYFAAEDLERAIEQYKKAVKLDQSSQDIRHNLELALRMLQQQQQQQQQEQDNDQEQGESTEDDKEKNKDQDNQENEEQDSSENDENDQQQDQENQQEQPDDAEQNQMTPEEAQRILDAMNDEEEKALDRRRIMMLNAMEPGDDW